jgi:CubicO group peptidase (beta-lactamase class C family)
MVVQSGQVVDRWGPVEQNIQVRSMRKGFLSALYGVYVAEGRIDAGKTLADLNIDDDPPALTPFEKQATILDLLRARSGVYHDTVSERRTMRARRPARETYLPGSFFYYNNWDFNVLGTVFQKLTGADIFDASRSQPGMQDFVPGDGRGTNVKGESKYPHYIFSMTARDMARFGYLYLRKGKWGGSKLCHPIG